MEDTPFTVVRKAVLPEDEGHEHVVARFWSQEEAQKWIDDQKLEYFKPADYYIRVKVRAILSPNETLHLPNTRMTIEARYDAEKLIYAGDAQMSQTQQDYYQGLIGDGKARVSVSRDEAEKDFGTGGGIGVTVTLTCGQTQGQVSAAIGLAHDLADGAVKHYAPLIKQDLINRGVLRP